MVRILGRGIGSGMAMGLAAAATGHGGPPAGPDGEAAAPPQSEFRSPPERPEVVLILDRMDDAAGAWPHWATVVAVLAERDQADGAHLAVPAVAGLEGLREAALDGTLVLVDADCGAVQVDPDMRAIAAFQEVRANRGRARLLLGHEHLPATTSDGVTVRVVASVADRAEVEMAMRNGADGLLVEWPSPDAAPFVGFLAVLEGVAPGKPLTIVGAPSSLPWSQIARAAASRSVAIGNGSDDFGPDIGAVRTASASAALRSLREGAPAGEPAATAVIRIGSSVFGAALAADRLLVRGLDAPQLRTASALRWMLEASEAATGRLIPFEVELPRLEPDALRVAIGLRVSAVVIRPDRVQDAKATIRGLDAGDCRAWVLQLLAGSRDDGPA